VRVRRIETPEPAALDLLAALEAACFDEPWSAADLAVYLGSGAFVVFVPEGEDPPAYALFQLLPGEAELLRIGVVPARRGRGIAAGLLSSALARLAAEERPVCHLEVRAGNRPARELYERLGFVVAGRRRAYYGDGEDAVRYLLDPRSGSG